MLVNRIKVTTSIDKELSKKIDELSDKTRIPKSKLFDEAIELLLKKHDE